MSPKPAIKATPGPKPARAPTSAPDSKPNRENPVVAIIRLLPESVRERAYYVSLAVIAAVVVFGLWHAPGTTVAGGSGLGFVVWFRGLFGR